LVSDVSAANITLIPWLEVRRSTQPFQCKHFKGTYGLNAIFQVGVSEKPTALIFEGIIFEKQRHIYCFIWVEYIDSIFSTTADTGLEQ